jgi:PKD domain-containing protein
MTWGRTGSLYFVATLTIGFLTLTAPATAEPRVLQQRCETGHRTGDEPVPEGEGAVDDADDSASARLDEPTPRTPSCPSDEGGSGGDDGDGSQGPPQHWETVNHEINNGDPDLPQTRTCPGGGPVVRYRLIDDATGEVLDTSAPRCSSEGAPPPEAVEALAPPTMEEVLDEAAIPQPAIAVNPSTEGITGMESWFWLTDVETTVAVTAELAGYQVTTNLEAVAYRWTIGDEATHTSTSPGSEADPAVRHTFDRKGTHTITVEMVWQGSYTYSGFGVDETVDGLEATTEGSVDYTVVEIVSVVDDPDEG